MPLKWTGGKQEKRRDTVEQKVQKMNFELGLPKLLYEAYFARERSWGGRDEMRSRLPKKDDYMHKTPLCSQRGIPATVSAFVFADRPSGDGHLSHMAWHARRQMLHCGHGVIFQFWLLGGEGLSQWEGAHYSFSAKFPSRIKPHWKSRGTTYKSTLQVNWSLQNALGTYNTVTLENILNHFGNVKVKI